VILTLFLALLALSVVVILLGYFTDDEPYLTVGLFFIFLLSFVILTGNLEYQTGTDRSGTFTFINQSGNLTTFGFNETLDVQYQAWDDDTSHGVGWGLAVVTGLGIGLSLYHTRKRRLDSNG
jgi:hypothetical protein